MKKFLIIISFIFLISIPINVFAEDTEQIGEYTYVKDNISGDKTLCKYKINGTHRLKFWIDNNSGTFTYTFEDEDDSSFQGAYYTIPEENEVDIKKAFFDNTVSKKKYGYCPDNIFTILVSNSSYTTSSHEVSAKKLTKSYLAKELLPIKTAASDIETTTVRTVDCSDFKDLTSPIWLWIRILAPILVIVLGGFDFFKVIAAGDEKEIKQSVNTFIKRLIILGILFMLPLLVNLVFGLVKGDITACLSDDFLGGNTNITEQDNTPDNNQDNDITIPRDQWKEEYDR